MISDIIRGSIASSMSYPINSLRGTDQEEGGGGGAQILTVYRTQPSSISDPLEIGSGRPLKVTSLLSSSIAAKVKAGLGISFGPMLSCHDHWPCWHQAYCPILSLLEYIIARAFIIKAHVMTMLTLPIAQSSTGLCSFPPSYPFLFLVRIKILTLRGNHCNAFLCLASHSMKLT